MVVQDLIQEVKKAGVEDEDTYIQKDQIMFMEKEKVLRKDTVMILKKVDIHNKQQRRKRRKEKNVLVVVKYTQPSQT